MRFEEQWLGRAFCIVAPASARYVDGTTGAWLNFACHASNVVEAATLIQRECAENDLIVMGLEYLMCRAFMDREPSKYEMTLIRKLPKYPVQFKDVFTFKPDG